MNFDDLMRQFGTQRAAADALGMKYQAVNNWLRAEPYPGKHAK